MFVRSTSRQLQTVTIARSSRALLACAVTAGLTVQFGAHPAKSEEQVTAEAYLADLVNQLSEAKGAVTDLELEMGGLREAANKARVDLSKAQTDAQNAQDSVVDARDRLNDSDDAVAKAQDDLDEIARSAYNTGGDASPVTLAAGEDSAGDALDRASYIRMATERQEGTVNRLDLARTQTANEEAELRDNRNAADKAVNDAVRAHNEANDALSSSQDQLREKRGEYSRLIAAQSLAQKRLNAARDAVNAIAESKPEASSWDKRRAAEAAVERVEEGGDPQTATAPTNDAPAEQTPDITPYSESADAIETNNGTTESTDSHNEGAPESDSQHTETPAAPAGPVAPLAETAAGSLGELENIPAQFAATADGDAQRQLAIDGLLTAGGAAAMAGFTTYANGGDQTAALNAALAAGRDSAGQQYDAAQAQLNASRQQSTTPSGTNTTSPISGASTPEDIAAAIGDDPASTIAEGVNSAVSGVVDGTAVEADSTVDTSGDAAAKIERVIDRGMSQMGMPYAWGGGNWYGPTLGIRDGGVADAHGDYAKVGFDCSGLMMYAFYAVGFQLDHYSGSQYNAGRQVPVSQIKRGDMLFWGAGGSQHVALYLGDGKMLEAPQSGDVVKISDVRYGGMTPMAVRMIE